MNQPFIECRGLHKWYSGVHALKNVNLAIAEGESVGLVGDNGAGKSTLINILSGVHRQDEGEILIDGKPVDIRNPKQAMNLGIETIYQYNSMVPTMSIARNLFVEERTTHVTGGHVSRASYVSTIWQRSSTSPSCSCKTATV